MIPPEPAVLFNILAPRLHKYSLALQLVFFSPTEAKVPTGFSALELKWCNFERLGKKKRPQTWKSPKQSDWETRDCDHILTLRRTCSITSTWLNRWCWQGRASRAWSFSLPIPLSRVHPLAHAGFLPIGTFSCRLSLIFSVPQLCAPSRWTKHLTNRSVSIVILQGCYCEMTRVSLKRKMRKGAEGSSKASGKMTIILSREETESKTPLHPSSLDGKSLWEDLRAVGLWGKRII